MSPNFATSADVDAAQGQTIVGSEQAQDQLARVLASEEFQASQRLTSMLRYLVHQALAGRGRQLKAYTIAVEAFGCDADFDSQTNPLVRIHASKLRRALERYYFNEGERDPIRIDLPKGHYAICFNRPAILPAQPLVEPPITRPSIAVLPLLNCSTEEGQDYFADGLTEELTIGLSRFPDLAVIACHSTLRFWQQPIDSRRVHQELGAIFLLSGSVRRASQTVRITIELIEAPSGKILWGDRFDRRLSAENMLTLQSEICQQVVARIADDCGVIVRTQQCGWLGQKTDSLTTYEATLAFYHYDTVVDRKTHSQALAQLRHAVAQDPNYAMAWAMLAELYADAYLWQASEIEQPLERMLEAVRRALALDPLCQRARFEMAYWLFFHRDVSDCIDAAKQAIALNPNAVSLVAHAGWLIALAGDWERGLRIMDNANELNPYHHGWLHLAPYLGFFRQGEYERAFAEAQAYNMPENRTGPILRAAALGQLGRREEARAAVTELLRLNAGFDNDPIDFISRFIVCDELRERLIDGLRKAGLEPGQAQN